EPRRPPHKCPTPAVLSAARPPAEPADHRHRRLLRARRERPRRRAAEQCDELAALHSMTSSARAERRGGTSRPSAFAVLRLMTNLNFLDCTTGSSAVFFPFGVRPGVTPACRYASVRAVP